MRTPRHTIMSGWRSTASVVLVVALTSSGCGLWFGDNSSGSAAELAEKLAESSTTTETADSGSGSSTTTDPDGAATGSAPTTIDPGVSIFDLEVGMCFDDEVFKTSSGSDGTEAPNRVDEIACTDEHDSEVFYTATVTEEPDADFPGSDALTEFGRDNCFDELDTYLGGELPTDIEVGIYYPTSVSWGQGDREVICVLFADDRSPLSSPLRAEPADEDTTTTAPSGS